MAYACNYVRPNPAIIVALTFVPVVLFGSITYWLRLRKAKRAKIIAFRVVTALTFFLFLYTMWENTIGWVSPCADWDATSFPNTIGKVKTLPP